LWGEEALGDFAAEFLGQSGAPVWLTFCILVTDRTQRRGKTDQQ
jgi:hypothetical protein